MLKPVLKKDDSGSGSASCQAESAPLRGNNHKPSSPTTWADWMVLCAGSFLLILPFYVPAAESIPEGMQSGQLLQAGAPAAGEGTGEQQPHHSTETEGRLRSGRRRCCGECVYVY